MELDEALASLEALMSEFFAPTTSNLRKREIESILENFSTRPDSWRHCLLFLQKSQNQYVLMFTLTTLENIINRLWISLPDNEKTEIRLTLWHELLEKHEVMVYFIRNKLASLMVCIARYDWPHLYTDFFDNIVQLVQCTGRRCLLGLALAQAASEEFGSARDGGALLPSARREQLERLMLRGMPQLLAALSGILERSLQKDAACNPPPSPSSGAPAPAALPDLLQGRDVQRADKALDMECVVRCLTALQQLFSWLPLSSHVPPALVATCFCWGSLAAQSQSHEAALAGLGCVCEVLYRRYAPPSSAATALRLHHGALRLLRHLAAPPPSAAPAALSAAPAPAPPDEYLNKLSEFLRLFVALHFKRLEAEPEFDAIEFLSYLFQFTFQVPTCAIFVNCLDVWIQFMDILKPEDTAKYWEGLRALVGGVLNKLQFQHNRQQLQQLDNDTVDDDGETEWQAFLKHCIECIARVAELAPLEVFTIVSERWQGLSNMLARAGARAAGGGEAAGDADRALAAPLDCATLTRLLGRLAPALLAEEGGSGGAAARAAGGGVVERAAAALAHAVAARRDSRAATVLTAELFACLGAWACYARECGVAPATVEGLFAFTMPFLLPHEPQEPALLSHAAAQLLLALAQHARPSREPALLLPDLLLQAQRSLHYLEPKTAACVREALLSLSLRGGGRAARALLAAWSAPLAAAPHRTLPALTQLLLAFSAAPTPVKKILAEGIQDAAQAALGMLCGGAGGAAEADITDFFLALFTSLLQQLGPFAGAAIDVFLDVAQRTGDEASIERLMQCVRLGVERGAGGAGPVLQLLRQHLAPGRRAAPAVYRLLASVLIHRWRYFFPNKYASPEEEAARMGELRAALDALGAALLDGDGDVLRVALDTLDTLNAKWKLYHKAIFRAEYLGPFLTVLLAAAGERGGARALLRDEVLAAVHALAAVDFAAFRTGFLPALLPPGLPAFPPDTDFPTFTQNILRLMNDVNCYRAYHALPAAGAAR